MCLTKNERKELFHLCSKIFKAIDRPITKEFPLGEIIGEFGAKVFASNGNLILLLCSAVILYCRNIFLMLLIHKEKEGI